MSELEAGPFGTRARVQSVAGGDAPLEALLRRILGVAVARLPAMFDGERRRFAFTLRGGADGTTQLEGESLRHGAVAALGARWLDESAQRAIFGGETALQWSARLAGSIRADTNLGDVALIGWLLAELRSPHASRVLDRSSALAAARDSVSTVELAWHLCALVAAREQLDTKELARAAYLRLLMAFSKQVGLFWREAEPPGGSRAHVASFLDQVHPIQALARYHAAFADVRALTAANRCAERICELQGPAGQWWWQYDVRRGRVIEGYPVYSAHQDAIAPMVLLELAEVGGVNHLDAVRRGLAWMQEAPEVGRSLVDEPGAVIWRKVGRSDPRGLVRALRALGSWHGLGLRLPLLDRWFPARSIELECRPDHLGWILHAWLGSL